MVRSFRPLGCVVYAMKDKTSAWFRRREMWWGCVGVLLITGCTTAERREMEHDRQVSKAMRTPLDPDITAIYSFYSNYPFMSFDEAGDPNPEGLKVSAFYAVSSKTKLGAYADGVIRFKMYRVQRPPGEEPVGKLVKIWEFDPEQARGWRVGREVPHLGWPYQFHLNWGEADVYGQEVRLVPEFEGWDGQIIRGSARSFRVPSRRHGYRLIDEPAEEPLGS